MTRATLIGLLFLQATGCDSSAVDTQQHVYPDEEWVVVDNPNEYGFDEAKLASAMEYADQIGSAAVMVVHDGNLVLEWGDTKTKYLTHSTRKSFASAAFGKYVANGTIDLDMTLAELGIDDYTPLTALEKTATIRQCLEARSGVYLSAVAESQARQDAKPARGTYSPGEYWLYNNWDFNVLGTIFEQLTGKTLFQAILEDVGQPIGVESFRAEDDRTYTNSRSRHAAYMFVISARDMARFGLLFERNGKWKDEQVIPKNWVEESTSYRSSAAIYGLDGYGYMWWVASSEDPNPNLPNADIPHGSFSARGYGGHYIMVIPEYDLVVVNRVNTFVEGYWVTEGEFGSLMTRIMEARL